MTERKIQVSIVLPRELKEQIFNIANKKNISFNSAVRIALSEWAEKENNE